MSKESAAQQGIRDAWDFWLGQHPVSIPEVIHDAIKEAATAWFNLHGEGLFKQAVAEWLDQHGGEVFGDGGDDA